MRLVADAGLWTAGSAGLAVAPTQLAAVLEVSGAVLSWTVDDPAAETRVTFVDLPRADWLWRVVGESGHVALAAAIAGESGDGGELELSGIDLLPAAVEPLRRLALGHWLRRWWPASDLDGITGLDRALLDAEIAVLTAAAQDFFTDDTLDSDVAWLLAPHAEALAAHVAGGDPRVVELVRACVDLAAEVGADGPGWPELTAAFDDSGETASLVASAIGLGHADDYALAAGPGAGSRSAEAIHTGVASVNWAAVQSATFDAAEDTVHWSIEGRGPVVAVVRVATLAEGRPSGVAVRLQAGTVVGTGILDADGGAVLTLVQDGQPLTESAAWNHDWSTTEVTVGARVAESRATRDRVREFARERLSPPPADAFLAEILAAESDY